MSSPEDRPPEAALARLAEAVTRAVERIGTLEGELARAEERIGEMETLLRRFREDGEAPLQMAQRLERLEAANEDMRSRIRSGREGVERLLGRVRFLESQRGA